MATESHSPSFFLRLHKMLSFSSKKLTLPRPLSSCEGAAGLGRVFSYFDDDGDGKISAAELRRCMGFTLSPEAAKAAVELVDSDGDGLLGFEEFSALVEAGGEEEEGWDLRAAFGVYEMEGKNCITAKSLRRALGRLGEMKSVRECAAMIQRFDLDGDGVLSFEEFRAMMLPSRFAAVCA